MTQPDAQTMATDLERVAERETHAFNQSLTHAPQEARSAFSAATTTAGTMRSLAGSQAAAIKSAREKSAELQASGFSEASRQAGAEADRLTVAAEDALKAAAAQGHLFVAATEATLKSAAVSKPGAAGNRQLARDELLRAAKGKTGFEVVTSLANLAGREDAIDAEIFDGFTERLIGDAEAWQTLRTIAIQKVIQLPKNAHIAAALAAIPSARKAIVAELAAAQMRIKNA